jgi:hypothetical protein
MSEDNEHTTVRHILEMGEESLSPDDFLALERIVEQLKSVRKAFQSSEQEKLVLCRGCYNDDYNHGLGGAKKCWHLRKAKIERAKFVHINDVPPWDHQRVVETLSCHRRQKYVKVGPNQTH